MCAPVDQCRNAPQNLRRGTKQDARHRWSPAKCLPMTDHWPTANIDPIGSWVQARTFICPEHVYAWEQARRRQLKP